DLREVRLRLPDIQVLALRDRDVVDQGRELDLDFLRGDLALLPFEGFVEALMDLPDALVLAFVVRLFRFPQKELRLARVGADRLHLADRVACRRQDLAHPVPQLGLHQIRLGPRPLSGPGACTAGAASAPGRRRPWRGTYAASARSGSSSPRSRGVSCQRACAS